MLQNLKVDMVYYKTNTDFEMEFNLCGCCRMRLLNDKVTEPKTFVASLARAVSRSRVIITVGPLKGENSTVALVASALSTNIVPADTDDYGIEDTGEVLILEGSTPLVTSAGDFGGCIIESGPQSMILLTDDKDIRKKIMTTLVHPYIEELSKQNPDENNDSIVQQIKDNATQTVEVIKEMVTPSEPEFDDQENTLIEDSVTEEASQDTAPETTSASDPLDDIFNVEVTETNTVRSDPQINAVDDILLTDEDTEEIPFHPFASIKHTLPWQKEKTEEETELDDNYNFEEVYTSKPKAKSKSKTVNILILVLFVLLLIAIAVLCYCVFYVPAKDGVQAGAYIRDIFKTLFG